MFAFFPLSFSLLLLALISYVAGQTPTPPPLSVPDPSSALSLSFTSTTSPRGSGNSNGSLSATSTSSAQFPSLSGLSECANNCLALAIAQDGCTSVVEVNCYCSPQANATRFADALVACTSQQCPDDLTPAQSIAQQFCALASTSTLISFPTSVPSSSIPFSSSSSPRPSSTSSSVPAPSSTGAQGTGGNGAAQLTYARGASLAALLGFVGAVAGGVGVFL